MAQYHRGRAKEYDVMDALKAQGYLCTRAASSKGCYDVIAIDPTGERNTRLVSVKRSGKATYCRDTLTAERKRLGKIHPPPHHQQEVWVWLDDNGWFCQEIIGG